MQKTDSSNVDWNSAEGKQATARLKHFLEHIDKTVPEGYVRKVVPIGTGEDGQELKIVTWGTP